MSPATIVGTEREHLRCWLGHAAGAPSKARPAGGGAWAAALKARRLSLEGRWAQAAAALDEAAKRLPREAAVRAWRGELALLTGEMDAARRELDAAAALDPKWPWTYAWRAGLRLRGGELGAAAEDARVFAGLLPRSAAGPAVLALVAAARPDGRDEARRALARARALDARAPWLPALSGSLRAGWGELAEAKADFDAAARGERSAAVLLSRAAVLNRLGKVKDALDDLARASALMPRSAEVHLMKATFHRDQAQYEQAEAAYGRALKLAAGDASILQQRARLFFVQGRLREAAADLARAGDGVSVRFDRVQVLAAEGRAAEAEKLLAGGVWPAGTREFLLGCLRCKQGRYAEAETLLGQAEARVSPDLSDKAGFFRWVARILRVDGPAPVPEGRSLLLMGLGYKVPYQASVESVRSLASAQRIYSNLSDGFVPEFLALFPAPFRAIVYRGTMEQAETGARAVVSGFARAKRLAMVTRGQPVVYGRLAFKILEKGEKAGARWEIPCSTSIFDSVGALIESEPAPGGLQVLDAAALEEADRLRPAVIYTLPFHDGRKGFLKRLRSLYRPSDRCVLLAGSGENEHAPVAATVRTLDAALAHSDPACTLYFPGEGA